MKTRTRTRTLICSALAVGCLVGALYLGSSVRRGPEPVESELEKRGAAIPAAPIGTTGRAVIAGTGSSEPTSAAAGKATAVKTTAVKSTAGDSTGGDSTGGQSIGSPSGVAHRDVPVETPKPGGPVPATPARVLRQMPASSTPASEGVAKPNALGGDDPSTGPDR